MAGPKRIIAVGGGKGGVGKSLITANLAIALARSGQRVIAVDADLGGANLHTCLGLDAPQRSLSHFIQRSVASLNDLVTPTALWNLSLISGARDTLDAGNPAHQQKVRILRALGKLECDDLIIDLGAGTTFNVLDFFLFAQHGILVITPEPTSEENAFRFLKAAYLRLLRTVQRTYGLRSLLEQAVVEFNARGLSTPRELLETVRSIDEDAGRVVADEMARFRPSLVVNQTHEADDRRLGERVHHAVQRLLGLDLVLLGSVPHDEVVWQTLRRRRPLLVDSPTSRAARAIEDVATALTAESTGRGVRGTLQRGLRAVLGSTSPAAGSPAPVSTPRPEPTPRPASAPTPRPVAATRPAPLPVLPAVETAIAATSANVLPATAATSSPPPGAPVVPPPVLDGGYDGAALRAIRLARGWSLEQISASTRIPRDKLQAIEDNNAAAFPARVYLRGFVQQFAKHLGLDGDRVAQDYLASVTHPAP
ncbi:MAG: helix-turn-helix domain-containing protein [Pseudomonadota bacterium]